MCGSGESVPGPHHYQDKVRHLGQFSCRKELLTTLLNVGDYFYAGFAGVACYAPRTYAREYEQAENQDFHFASPK
jgi:hypothetical protein